MSKTSWLDDYISYCQGLTDAPTVFHRFVGLTILGSAMGNRWKMPNHKGRYDYPNLWCLIIANSSVLHKSTAAEIGLGLARDADVPYQASYGSTEALSNLFIKTPYGIIYADEFDDFLKGIHREHLAGRGFFASLYDGVVAPQVFNRGSSTGSFSVAASFLACTTMAWLTAHMGEDDLTGGLLPRFILIPAWESDRDLMELPPTDLDESTQQRLVIRLRAISGQSHICRRSPGADLVYKAWFRRVIGEPLNGTRGEAWPSRVTTVCHKLAMIYHADRGGPDGVLTETDMKKACDTCSEVLQGIKNILTHELALTRIEKDLQTVKKILNNPLNQDASRWVNHALLMRNSHMDARHLHSVLDTARQGEMIEFGHAKRGHPPIRLRQREPGDNDQ